MIVLPKMDSMSLNKYDRTLRFSDHDDVKKVLAIQKERRADFRSGFNQSAYTHDREMYHIGTVPSWLTRTKWYQDRFPHDLPPDELHKRRMEFFRANPFFRSTDKAI